MRATSIDLRDEIVRQSAMGLPTREIAESTGVCAATVSKIRNEPEIRLRIEVLQGGRDVAVADLQEEMLQRRIALAARIWEDLDNEYRTMTKREEFDSKFAFSILDRTEGIPAKKLQIESTPAVFSPADIEKANKASGVDIHE